MAVKQESLFIPDGEHQLHLRHIVSDSNAESDHKPVVFMVHGAIENGKIFYTEKGKGLACYLAEHGFDVYVMDLRGRGESIPRIRPFDDYGQTETILHDLPLLFNYIHARCEQPIHLIAHSWGGVLLTSMLARFPEMLPNVASKTYFGTKRSISVFNTRKFFTVDMFWNRLARLVAKKKGYLPAAKMNFGSDDETIKSLEQSVAWVKRGDWVDTDDQFDYRHACEAINWPPTWHITAINDTVLGHPVDVKRFADEAGQSNARMTLLSKENGNKHDYDHIDMLTHKLAVEDHFPDVVSWLKQASQ